jgi:hypothetical protein
MRPLYLLVVLLLIPIACSTGKIVVQPDPSQEDHIREAVFRYQFKRNASAFQDKTEVYFLSIGGGDPSDQFMRRFEGHTPVVKKVSEAIVSSSEVTGVKDKKTGQRGLIFNQRTIKWDENDHVEVEGGYYEAGLSASGNTYSVVKENNEWVVTKSEMHWIS